MFLADIRKTMLALSALSIAVVLFSFIACGGSDGTTSQDGWLDQGEEAVHENEGSGESGENTATAGAGVIHMCGRSVLGGWFEHWGWDYDPGNPVTFDGYTLVYHEMESPPGIVGTALKVVRQVGDRGGGTVFFKLCFADFVGGDEYGARENLETNKEIIRTITDAAASDEGLILILGNALPMVREYTDNWLVWNHREYNRFLDELAGSYKGRVLILDLYGTLAASDGWLRPDYASDPSDSHLNDKAYSALDKVFRGVLGKLPPSQ